MPPTKRFQSSSGARRRRNNRRIEEDEEDRNDAAVNGEVRDIAPSHTGTNEMDVVGNNEDSHTSMTFIATIDTTLSTTGHDQQHVPSKSTNKGSATAVSTNARPITAASLGQLHHVPPMWLVSSTNIVSAMNSVNKNNREHNQMLCVMNLIDSEKGNTVDYTTRTMATV